MQKRAKTIKNVQKHAKTCKTVHLKYLLTKNHASQGLIFQKTCKNVQKTCKNVQKRSKTCISNDFGPYSKTCIVKVRASWGRVSRGLTVYCNLKKKSMSLHCLTLFLLAVVTWQSYMGWLRPWPLGIGLSHLYQLFYEHLIRKWIPNLILSMNEFCNQCKSIFKTIQWKQNKK